MAQRSAAKRLWYGFLQVFCRLLTLAVCRIRVVGREHVPQKQGGLLLSNHQSHLDPVLLGLACDRRLNYLARESLFRFTPFRWLIQSLDAIPIDREGVGLSGLKETLRRLKQDELVLIFPEGTRTRDGEISPLKPGFWRARPPRPRPAGARRHRRGLRGASAFRTLPVACPSGRRVWRTVDARGRGWPFRPSARGRGRAPHAALPRPSPRPATPQPGL